MKDIIDCFVYVEIVLNNGYHTVGSDCSIDLNADGILISSPEFLDTKMLLLPFEEELYLPSVLYRLATSRAEISVALVRYANSLFSSSSQ